MVLLRKLLWVDCIAAGLAGVILLMLSGWLSNVYALPRGLLVFNGVVNLLYASYSFTLARQTRRSRYLIYLLVFANLTWSAACVAMAWVFSGTATLFGLGHLVGEAIFVGGLAMLEWSQRDQLLSAV